MFTVTGVAQQQALRDGVLPPVEQVRPGLWSIPIPLPIKAPRYVLVYALELPDGLAIVDAGWDTTEAWDALVCVSSGVQKAVSFILDEETRYLEDRFDAARITRPMLPVIPLGVDPGEFAPDPAARAAWRKRLGIGASDFAVLCFGRLSAQSKANPLALFLVQEEVAARVP